MSYVKFTKSLDRFFPDLADVVAAVDSRFPGLGSYIVDEHGTLRRRVNIFVGDE